MKKQQLGRKLIRLADRAISTAFMAVLLLALFLAVCVIVDNRRIMAEAGPEVYQSYKPIAGDTFPFDDLVAINPDVVGWLTIKSTNIDYPLVQGKDNTVYINKSVMGDFSLSGALFLDSRNAPDFSDPVSIVYGHNMAGDLMFGGIDNYDDPAYFSKHLSGLLYYGGEYYKLEIFAKLSTDGYDTKLYNPRVREEDLGTWLDYADELVVNRTDKFPESGPILLMSTCASGQTNSRDLLAATITPGAQAPASRVTHSSREGLHLSGLLKGVSPWAYLVPAGVVLVGLTILFGLLKRRKRREDEDGEKREQKRAVGEHPERGSGGGGAAG